jgi:hypothetical protein
MRRSAPSNSASVRGSRCRAVFTRFGSGNDPYDPVELGSGILGLFGSNITTVATDSVTLQPGSLTSVSAGGLMIPYGSTVDGTNWAFNNTLLNGPPAASLHGTLKGAARYDDLGGEFALVANQLATALPLNAGFTRSFEVSLGQGDIILGAGQTLKSETVLLVANTGSIYVDGTIDASAASGGSIGLYGAGASTAAAGTAGASGVTIGADARLYARYQAPDVNSPGYANGESTLVQRGGTITLGTTGTPDRDANNVITLNASYGYENVSGSGAITVASGAVFDVSGGAGGANIDNTGGSVVIRAPILTDNSVNVDFRGTVRGVVDSNGNATGRGVVLNAYAVWSTTDSSTGGKHFDGIIDPAGWFDGNGNPLMGTDQNGNAIAAPTADAPLASGQVVTVGTANSDHVGFYQTTLLNFVENFTVTPAAGGASFSSIANFHARPEIDLINPSLSINSGNIIVAQQLESRGGDRRGFGSGQSLLSNARRRARHADLASHQRCADQCQHQRRLLPALPRFAIAGHRASVDDNRNHDRTTNS